ncbi:hypothetical protein SAMN05421638_0161 [Kaistella treverensis]|uniref:Uncharacterized protein n=1 Tax=Kaistella treverensis TaxID=631455 RepID=A0A1I3JGC8_9FLAO|nr:MULTISPECIES: hypothetical protein [Kaistella]SFI59289.1 hypothetical protein SAMN05421638_0161 [Kaistella treverensis]
MEPRKKNTPGPIVIFAIVSMIIAIISYLILQVFFPDLFRILPTGTVQPVPTN